MIPRPCHLRHPDPAETAGSCVSCWQHEADPGYRALYGSDPATARPGLPPPAAVARALAEAPRPAPSPRPPRTCAHLGPPTGERRPLLNCHADPPNTIPLRACAVHRVCTEDGVARGKPMCCRYCSDDTRRKPPARPPIARRNLLFHLHPVPGRWEWHAEQIRARAPLFNGRRLVAVTTGPGLTPPDQVAAALPGCEVLAVPNNPDLREVATFERLFGALAADPEEATLYAQGKSVTREPSSTCPRWTEILWEAHCDYWPVVAELLAGHPVAGTFFKRGHGWSESASDWHYSGSWLWFRNSELLGRPDWRRIDRFWSGIEPYPSLHFAPDEAGVIFFAGQVGVVNLYDRVYFNLLVEPAWARWQEAHADRRATP